jgi:hypothetical protein
MKLPEIRYYTPPPSEQFAVIRFSQAFHREVAYRQERERYCQWYHETADQHRAEYHALQQDLNILGWFRRR